MAGHLALIRLAHGLARDLDTLQWRTPSHVYNPLDYAWDGYHQFLQRYGDGEGRVLLVGMNPGPWGMTQTGIPFGSIGAVRNWFHISTKLRRKLPEQHPKYPILGMACHRNEGSGGRLWDWAEQRLGPPEAFFARFFVWNYCPLLFLGNNRNMIPSQLKADEQRPLDALCTEALEHAIRVLKPVAIVALGRYAEKRVHDIVGERVPVVYLLHPSPANPAANKHWPEHAEAALGPWLPPQRSA